jgi:tape measure domain-containing protein
MARTDLNVTLGLQIQNFEKALKKAERRLQRTVRNMEQQGSALTQAVSLPVIGVGAAALRSAAEFEQFEKALIAVTGSTEEAQAQLGRLQKIAEAPGIGFNQAVQASLQLQGLGVEASRAEEAITQVANAVAASGGGADEFAGVVRQLNQIQAKNRVLQEDVGILLENAPILGEQLQQAFGGKTAQAIRAAGVDGQAFFDGLIAQLGTLERVEGGLANTFENFSIATRKALSDLGQELDKAFDIRGIVDRLTNTITNAVDIFRNLDAQTQRNVVRFVAFAAAAGPVLLVGSKIITVFSGAFRVYKTLAIGLATAASRLQLFASASATSTAAANASTRSTKGLAGAFRALSVAQKAAVALPIAAVIGAAALVFDEYRTNVAAASASITVLADAQRASAKEISNEVGQIEILRAQLTKENATRGEKAEAIQRIKDINPGYFADLDTETSKIGEVEAALDSYVQKLGLSAELKVLTNDLGRVTTALNNQAAFAEEAEKNVSLLDKAQTFLAGSVSALTRDYSTLANTTASETAEAFNLTTSSLERQKSAIDERVAEIKKSLAALGGEQTAAPTVGAPSVTSSVVDAQAAPSITITDEALQALNNTLSSTAQLSQQTIAATSQLATNVFPGLSAGIGETGQQLSGLNESASIFGQTLGGISEASRSFSERLQEQLQLQQDRIRLISEAVQSTLAPAFGAFFETVANGGSDAFGKLADNLIKALKKIIVELLTAIATAAAFAAVLSIIFPGVGAAAGGFSGLFTGFLGGGGGLAGLIPGLAQGGIVPDGYPNDTYLARLSSGEAVIPLSKLNGMLDRGGATFIPSTTLRGEDIVISYQRASKNLNR